MTPADNEKNSIGFGDLEKDGEDDKAVKKFFSPEFRNRLDAVIKFSKLKKATVRSIVDKFVKELNQQLKDKRVEIILDTQSIDWLADHGYDSKMGARPLARLIDNKIKSPLSRKVLFGDLADGGIVKFSLEKDGLVFAIEPMPVPLTKAERKALKATKIQSDEVINENQDQ